jgi:hypothetical protein
MSNRSLLALVALLVSTATPAHAQGVGFAEQLAAAEAIWKRAPLRSYEYTLHYGAFVIDPECEPLLLRLGSEDLSISKGNACHTSG